MPTFERCGCSGGRVACFDSQSAADMAAATETWSFGIAWWKLLHGDVGVVLGHKLAVFPDLNGISIQDSHGDVLPAKFHCPVAG